ncbi:aminopeptidase P family protein [Flavobacterium quisquiliarum]|uniref:Xaa-Pro aminopeptidase n=1 Tax=Flavobacterium quisquiliarum TaxID=1834436 RepID=A0ABV8W2Y1_9FLAO|nr:aminopeptidase P family protein [Flavobacterium quisquiliarum]MBW1655642.1 M24 family metallopeptidase [Flavobacterium quisquiliarum]NWL03265.1 Xaa-Pro aminopeptidase [Flavobacterium collinsii]
MFSRETYINRRQVLKKAMGSGLIILPGNEEVGMNYRDNIYHFRQDSSFLYYAGIDRPSLFLIIDIDADLEILFGDNLTIEQTVWVGPQDSLNSDAEKTGITTVQPLSFVEAVLKNAVQQKRAIHFLPPYRAAITLKLSSWLDIHPNEIAKKSSIPLCKAIIAQRSYKTNEELIEIEKAVNITAAMHLKAIQSARPGMTEYEIAGQVEGTAISLGGHLAFPTILTVNGQYLHNHAGSNVLKEGQLVLCDCGAENNMRYAGDMTRTFPVSKTFTTQQKEIYNIVLKAEEAAVATLKPGTFFKDSHLTACKEILTGLKSLGLVKGDLDEAVAAGAHTLFFQCGLGHMMGMDVHDMENIGEEYVGYTETLKKSTEFGLKSLRLAKELEEGFVLTVEPGIYFIPELIDQWQVEKKYSEFINYDKVQAYRNFGGIRIEEDFLITKESYKLLGKPLAKTAEDIEALRNY